ncbi:MAG TPA: hypothetical protein VM536_10435, partial [Chloroflexia bacterium]|nr:hypothetical protein [Chloroflexia bacterium]
DGTFRPYAQVTRGQMSKMIVNAFGWPIVTAGGPHFVDVTPSNAFYGQIETIWSRGLVSGYTCGGVNEPCPGTYFRWAANNTRGQLAKVLSNALGP